MKHIMRICTIAAALAITSLALIAQTTPEPQSQPKPAPQKPEPRWYRIDISVHEFENSKKINTRNYALVVQEGDWGRIKIGSRLPVPSGPNAAPNYIDVGMNTSCRLRQDQGKLGLDMNIDLSSVVMDFTTFSDAGQAKGASGAAPIIRSVRSETGTEVSLGKVTNVASIDDPIIPNRKFQIEVTVTRTNP